MTACWPWCACAGTHSRGAHARCVGSAGWPRHAHRCPDCALPCLHKALRGKADVFRGHIKHLQEIDAG
jgi:hypothetical protein